MTQAIVVDSHPLDGILRADRMPHIFCPGCGIGIAMRCYAQALLESGIPQRQHVVVSGIGCTGRVAGYIAIDSYHTTHGRAIPFATGLKLANPNLMVTVFSGDGDLAAIGEVGLSGELRAVGHLGRRLNEAAKLGFRRCIVPATHRKLSGLSDDVSVIPARALSEALAAAVAGQPRQRGKNVDN